MLDTQHDVSLFSYGLRAKESLILLQSKPEK